VKFEDFEEATPQTPRMPGTRHPDFSDVEVFSRMRDFELNLQFPLSGKG